MDPSTKYKSSGMNSRLTNHNNNNITNTYVLPAIHRHLARAVFVPFSLWLVVDAINTIISWF